MSTQDYSSGYSFTEQRPLRKAEKSLFVQGAARLLGSPSKPRQLSLDNTFLLLSLLSTCLQNGASMTNSPNTVIAFTTFYQKRKGLCHCQQKWGFFLFALFEKYLMHLPPRSAQNVISQPTPEANEVSMALTKFPKSETICISL